MIFVFLILFFLIYANFYIINFLTVSPLDSLSICIIQTTLINFFMVITDLFILFLSLTLLTTMICDINCCESKIIKFTTTISLYVIQFILFNHIIRGKEGKTGFNGVFCYSSDDSINDDKKQLIMIAYGMIDFIISSNKLLIFLLFFFLYI